MVPKDLPIFAVIAAYWANSDDKLRFVKRPV
jgi:hypothetical protein